MARKPSRPIGPGPKALGCTLDETLRRRHWIGPLESPARRFFPAAALNPSATFFLHADPLASRLAHQIPDRSVSRKVGAAQGETRQFACSGIFIEFDLGVSILTSASLVRSADDENKIDHKLQIKVYLPNGLRVIGTLQYCNLQYNIAVVNTIVIPDFRVVNIYDPVRAEIGCKVVAVGRIFNNGRLTSTCGIITGKKRSFDCDELMVSTCKITKDGIGGPIIDFNGNFIGMNFDDKGKTSFLPGDVILGLTHLKSRGLMIVDDLSERNQTRSPVHEPYWLDASIDEPADPLLELALRPMELI
ncbi:hypothetical protein EJB05_44404, partial [Eragrostis curvula]